LDNACLVALAVGDLATADCSAAMLLQHSVKHVLGYWRALGRCSRRYPNSKSPSRRLETAVCSYRVANGSHGAIGTAKWTGEPLRDVLYRAGVKAEAIAVRCNGLDEPVVEGAQGYMKSLDIRPTRAFNPARPASIRCRSTAWCH
jgi:hypothetical protein